MATSDVPGANPANADTLHSGCWAEHSDGSLIYVKGAEQGQIVYEIYDLAQSPPCYYQDAMHEDAFKKAFSFGPTGQSKEKWTWHDKTAFPWGKVMKTFDKPRPVDADVADTLSAAASVAKSLRLRAQRLNFEDVEPNQDKTDVPKSSRGIIERIQKALNVLLEG